MDKALKAVAGIVIDNASNANRQYNSQLYGEMGFQVCLLNVYSDIEEIDIALKIRLNMVT